MSYRDQLVAEINAKLSALAADGRPWTASWIAHAICGEHLSGLTGSEDAEFWRHCGYAECRDEVRKCINRRAGDRAEHDADEPHLPGFEHLQTYYMVKREGDEIGVSAYDLTDEEIEAKAALYRSMGTACYAHADELDRFRRTREAPPLFAALGNAEVVA